MVEHKSMRERAVAFQLWTVVVCCCTLFHQGTCLPSRSCVAISSASLCASLGYKNTSFPNPSGHRTQDEANSELENYKLLLNINCSPYLRHFICAYYIPFCKSAMPLDLDITPCRELCIHVREGCLPVFKRYGAQWPVHLTCERFPTKDDAPWCFGPDERSSSTTISPTSTVLETSSGARDHSSKLSLMATLETNSLQTADITNPSKAIDMNTALAASTSKDSSLATATPEASLTIAAENLFTIEESPSLLTITDSPTLFTIEENLSSFENPSPFTSEGNPNSFSIKDNPSSFTIEGSPSSFNIENNPSSFTIEGSPSSFNIENNPSSFTIEGSPSLFSIEDNPSSFTIEGSRSSFTIEGNPSLFTIDENPSLFENFSPLNTEASSLFMSSSSQESLDLFITATDNSQQLQSVPTATTEKAQTTEIQQVTPSAAQTSAIQTAGQLPHQSDVLSIESTLVNVQTTPSKIITNAQSSITNVDSTISFAYLFDTSYTPSDATTSSYSVLPTPTPPHPSISFHTAVETTTTHPPASRTQLPSPTPRCTHLDNTSRCHHFGYSLISLPNSRGHTNQQQAEEELARFTFFLKLQCSVLMEQFLCLYYLPPCNATIRVPPCRDLCELVREDCIAVLQQFYLKWPQHMNCTNLPYQHSNTCAIKGIVKSPMPSSSINLEGGGGRGGSQMEKASLLVVTATALLIIILLKL